MSGRIPAVDSLLVPPTSRAWVQVDLESLAENTRLVHAELTPGTRLLAVVKADAYGHGAEAVSRTVLGSGASWLGVATVDEGVALRRAELTAPILLQGYVDDEDLIRVVVGHGITATLCSVDNADRFATRLASLAARGAIDRSVLPLRVHAKIDTGMSRLGGSWRETDEFAAVLERWRAVVDVEGFYSHLASADHPDPTSREEQRLRFEESRRTALARGLRPRIFHLANSAATLVSSAFHYDMVRIGLALYGMCPGAHLDHLLPLRPVLEVKARVTQVRRVPRGVAVSYGATFIAPRPMRVATVGIGFADGIPWSFSGRMEVLVRGQRVRQVGRVTMDQIMLDVTDVDGVTTGDEVTVIGRDGTEEISVLDWAKDLATIPWEVTCLFKSRLPRVATSSRRRPESDGFATAPSTRWLGSEVELPVGARRGAGRRPESDEIGAHPACSRAEVRDGAAWSSPAPTSCAPGATGVEVPPTSEMGVYGEV